MSLPIACIAIEAAILRLGVDDLDEGYFVQQATRVLHGQVPFRDFATLYSPGLLYLHAGAFALTGGPSLLVARALALAARAGLVLSLYAITRKFVRNPWWAAAPGVVVLLGFDDAPVRWEPHPGWLSTFFAVLAAWCLIHHPTRRGYLCAGAAAAAAYAFKQNTGAFILLAILAWCGLRRFHLSLAMFAALTLAWLLPLGLAVGDLRQLAPLTGAVNEASLFAGPEPTLLIPVAALLVGLWRYSRDSDPRLRWLLLSGTALFLTELPRMDTQHLAWAAPLLLVLGAVILDRQRPLVAGLALTACALVIFPTLASRATLFAQPLARMDGVFAPTQTASDIADTLVDIQQRTDSGEPIFVYPTSPLLYLLSGRPNPTRFDHLNPGAAGPADITRVVADLERAQVRLVVISEFWENAWGTPSANAALEDWLNAHFREVARHGAYRVLVAGL